MRIGRRAWLSVTERSMSMRRRLASGLLRAIVRGSSREPGSWPTAILHELEYVDGDWAALWWALGGATAVFRRAVPRYLRARGVLIKRLGRTTAELVSGAAVASGMMGICLAVLVHLPNMSWLRLVRSSLLEQAAVIVGLETICLIIAFALWRRRRSVASGALVAGTTLLLHVVTYG